MLLAWLLVIVPLWVSNIVLSPLALARFTSLIAASALLGLFRSRLTRPVLQRFGAFCECQAALAGICLAGAVGSYAAAALSNGYVDHRMAAVDQFLGFDWPFLYGLMAASPTAQLVSKLAYASIFVGPQFVLLALCATGEDARARRFVTIYGMTLIVVVMVFPLVPAVGPITHYGVAEPDYVTATSSRHVEIIEALRAGSLRTVDVGEVAGLISVPSFHAATALLLIWAAWPLRRARYLVGLVNIAMLVATPIEGNHYLVDVIAGLALAAAAIGLPSWWPQVRAFPAGAFRPTEILTPARLPSAP
ncbi:phosphatase PAP2 family protein [Sphingomonas astaxanthinifaciens]|uniref:Inositolphosphotransferase Aur1/Ipt1 domain-containing protein n=2 Tax=Sphingomonas TaxID=13687 RepID=A0ABQ5Z7Z0_9SPHN|nr:phosphatase PAP2 family protein [Sphingomonas astaxanthinifaciens]GLR48079.1 hypothetical protein GCM10007925_17920 [Sphingomonas astaxanthinifaciens DSM 22298]